MSGAIRSMRWLCKDVADQLESIPQWRRKATAATEGWGQHLANRKRAFKHLRSKEVTAYKKRRTADRSRAPRSSFSTTTSRPRIQAMWLTMIAAYPPQRLQTGPNS